MRTDIFLAGQIRGLSVNSWFGNRFLLFLDVQLADGFYRLAVRDLVGSLMNDHRSFLLIFWTQLVPSDVLSCAM